MSNPLYDQLFLSNAGKSEPFLILRDGQSVTYADFIELASQFAHVLKSHGLQPDDRLAAQVEKSPEALALYAACVQAGVIYIPLNTAYTTDELRYFIDDSGASMIVCGSGKKDAVMKCVLASGARVETLDADGSGSFVAQAQRMPKIYPTAERDIDALAALLYTSGTTGRSKGAMLSQGNLLTNAKTLAQHWEFTSKDVLLHALPIFHTHGLFVATNISLVVGSSMIFLGRFDTNDMIELMPKATVMMGVPTFYTRLLDDSRFCRKSADGMRLFISGSAPLLAETHIQFEQLTGHKLLERYGMTETNMNTSNPYTGDRRAGTVGLPLPGVEIRITGDDPSVCLPCGDVGQIEVRGPNVFSGYWKMPEKTAEELQADGFFITGDLGKIDSDGYVHIVGRSKDLIISGGYNIYPKEIEALIDAQKGVKESAVIGIPNADFGESVMALIVAESDVLPDLDQLAKACTQSLARFKHPRHYILIESLPRNAMGKVQKKELREVYGVVE